MDISKESYRNSSHFNALTGIHINEEVKDSSIEILRFGKESFGGGDRDRTDDLLRARQTLSQLSYTPT